MPLPRMIRPAILSVSLLIFQPGMGSAQTASGGASQHQRELAAAADWRAGAERREALRAQLKHQREMVLQAKLEEEDKQSELEIEAKAKKKIAAFALKQLMHSQNERETAARKDWLDSEKRRETLRAALAAQENQSAADDTPATQARAASDQDNKQRNAERERAQREAAAAKELQQAAARRDQLRATAARQAALDERQRLKAAAKARAMALITRRAREAATARQAKAEAAAKVRRAAIEKAKAVARAKVLAARQAAKTLAAAKAAKALKAAKAAALAQAEAKTRAAAQAAVQAAAQAKAAGTVVIATWGGGYGEAQQQALFAPFEKQSGLTTRSIRHSGAANQQIVPRADVLNISSLAAEKGCQAGSLYPLDDLSLKPAPGEAPIAADLIDGARTKCGVASMAWSHVLLVQTKSFKRRKPTSLKHVFDVRRYPGKRAFVKSPRYILELALMADGVKPGDVYEKLGTYEGLSRALTKLEPLRPHIIWVDRAAQAYKLLLSGKAAIASGYSGRAFRLVTSNPTLKTIWDGQIYDVDYWTIPKTASNKKAAKRFIQYATAPKSLAANARHFPYGPMRRSAVAMTGRHNILDIDLQPFLPTSTKNLRSALKFNALWWAKNEEQIRSDPWFEEITQPVSKATRANLKRGGTRTAITKSRRKKRSTQ